MTNKSVKRYPLSKQVADQLEKMIADGEYAVGQKINTETELMDIFSVSRNTLREAIQSLTSAGVLEVRQGDGTYVRSNNRFNANMSLKYRQVSPDQIFEARNCLEITIAHLAAERRSEEELADIRAALAKRQQLKDTVKENTRADMEFHKSIANACHNTILLDLYDSLFAYMEEHIAERQVETTLSAEEIDRLHVQLYEAIKAQDPDQASAMAHSIAKI